MTTPKGGGFLI